MQAQLDRLQQKYDFKSWNSPDGPISLVWRVRLSGHELPGWRPHRIQQVDLPGQPPANLSVWRPADGNGALLAVNVYECHDATAARRHLLALLGEFQGPGLERADAPGDVAFSTGASALLFARNNLVLLVRSIERTPAPVADSARRLDTIFAGDTDTEADQGPTIDSLSVPAVDILPGQAIPITAAASDPSGSTVWFLFTTETGNLHTSGGNPFFTPATASPVDIDVTAVGPGGSTRRTLRVGPAAEPA